VLNKKTLVFFGVAILGVVLDQVTKHWIVANIEYRYGEIQVIDGFFSLVHAQNPGAAWGMFSDMEYRQYMFLGFTVIAVGVIVDLWRKLPPTEAFLSFTMGLILSGAIGNAIDRVLKGTVTDFLRVYTEHPSLAPWLKKTIGMSEWPSFNVADAALVVGVCLFLVHYLFLEEKEPKPEAAPPGPADAASGT
jgi:signal peptidase II